MKIEAIKTLEDNYTLAVDDVLLHSKYYPTEQGKKFIDKQYGSYPKQRNNYDIRSWLWLSRKAGAKSCRGCL